MAYGGSPYSAVPYGGQGGRALKCTAADTITIGGGVAVAASARSRTTHDTVALTDRAIRPFRTVAADTVGVRDVISRIPFTHPKTAADTVAVGGGAANRWAATLRQAQDVVAVSDLARRLAAIARSITYTIAVHDVPRVNYSFRVADTIPFADQVGRGVPLRRLTSDPIILADIVAGMVHPRPFNPWVPTQRVVRGRGGRVTALPRVSAPMPMPTRRIRGAGPR